MAGNLTFAMIKPGATEKNLIGPILAMINEAGFKIIAMKYTLLTENQVAQFYEVHKGKPFYYSLIEFMSSAPIVALILKKENAVEEFRELIGATDPEKAERGTVRRKYAESIQRNVVHGSDSDENAIVESDFHFSKTERHEIVKNPLF